MAQELGRKIGDLRKKCQPLTSYKQNITTKQLCLLEPPESDCPFSPITGGGEPAQRGWVTCAVSHSQEGGIAPGWKVPHPYSLQHPDSVVLLPETLLGSRSFSLSFACKHWLISRVRGEPLVGVWGEWRTVLDMYGHVISQQTLSGTMCPGLGAGGTAGTEAGSDQPL